MRQVWIGRRCRGSVIYVLGLDFRLLAVSFGDMRLFSMLLSTCFMTAFLCAEVRPLPLGAADLAPDPRVEALRTSTLSLGGLDAAFEAEAVRQLDVDYDLTTATDLERLQAENAQLKIRVSELERRLAAVEAKLAE